MIRKILGFLAVAFLLCYLATSSGCTISFQNICSIGSKDNITDDLKSDADIDPELEVPAL
jgi:hypothetical protein